jgi:hypothetical protein
LRVAGQGASPNAPEPPIVMPSGIYWVASYPRSGNTWVRAFLTVLARGKLEDGEDALAAPWRRGARPDAPDLIALLRDRYEWQSEVARSMPGPFLLKTHASRVSIENIPTIRAEATLGAVYLVRDPRDVAVSYAAFLRQPIEAVIRKMNDPNWVDDNKEPVGSWSMNVVTWTAAPNVLVIRYEDLLAAPIKFFRTIVEHIGYRSSLADIARASAATSFDQLKARDARAPIHKGRVTVRTGQSGQWKQTLTPEQVARIENAHGALMKQFGYTLPENRLQKQAAGPGL